MTNEPAATDVPPDPRPVPTLEDRLAPVMFYLGFAYLLALAGLIHRAPHLVQQQAETGGDIPLELRLMYAFVAILWPAFVIEAGVAVIRRAPEVSRLKAVLRALLVVLIPPMRIGWVHPATNRVWIPRLGWRPPGKPLLRALDKVFAIPMFVFAFLILPVLGMQYVQLEKTYPIPGFDLALDISIALIWVAFAFEFMLKVQCAPSATTYMKERWLDLAIVGLPTLEYLLTSWVDAAPLLRLLRLGRAIGPQQIGAMSRMYRLRGLLTKGWHAFMLLEGVARITGNTPEKQLRRIEDQIAGLEEQLAELRDEADGLRKKIAAKEFPAERETAS
jgi:hypothetical protein